MEIDPQLLDALVLLLKNTLKVNEFQQYLKNDYMKNHFQSFQDNFGDFGDVLNKNLREVIFVRHFFPNDLIPTSIEELDQQHELFRKQNNY